MNCESESKYGLYIDITDHFSFPRFSSKGKTCILNWNLGKESWRVGIAAFAHTNKPPLLREISSRLWGIWYPSRKNCADGKEASILVFATANTSKFCFMISRRFSDLFVDARYLSSRYWSFNLIRRNNLYLFTRWLIIDCVKVNLNQFVSIFIQIRI